MAGFAKGGAKVKLSDSGAGTLLDYAVDANVGGKLAQIGGRLIEGTVNQMAGDFFAKFGELVSAGGANMGATPAANAATLIESASPAKAGTDSRKYVWIAAAAVVVVIVIVLLSK